MDILFEDDMFLVVNKPACLAALPGGWEKSENLLQILEAQYGKLWIVHRLDKISSGVILFTRNANYHRILSQLFESHLVSKQYHIICSGSPKWDEHTARHRLRLNVGHKHRTVIDHARGITAITHFRILERLQGYILMEASTETGRTHQVRAHASAIGHPVLADTLYGAPQTEFISRPAFHAYALRFQLDGKSHHFSAPYPDDIETALKRIRAGY